MPLHLGEFEDYADKLGKFLLCFLGDGVRELETAEGDIYQVAIQEQMLRILVGEDDHEGLDQGLSEDLLN